MSPAPEPQKPSRRQVPKLQSPDQSLAGSGPGGTADLSHERIEDAKHNDWRRKATSKLLNGFLILNYGIFVLIGMIRWTEVLFPDASKIITPNVILALITAFAVQFGLMAGFVGKSLASRAARDERPRSGS
jgi:hypothetical protein